MLGAAWNDVVSGLGGSGFIYDGATWTPFNDPLGVDGTFPIGVNKYGDISGYYADAFGNFQAFVAAPAPETSTWAMMLTGFAGLGFVRYRASRSRLRGRRLAAHSF
jgi:hypothetical protein